MLREQDGDGSWSQSVIDTSTAVLTLHLLNPDEPAVARGRAWIKAKKQNKGWIGEPVLYFWFENMGRVKKMNQGDWHDQHEGRRFFLAFDCGKITEAWAKLALATENSEDKVHA